MDSVVKVSIVKKNYTLDGFLDVNRYDFVRDMVAVILFENISDIYYDTGECTNKKMTLHNVVYVETNCVKIEKITIKKNIKAIYRNSLDITFPGLINYS